MGRIVVSANISLDGVIEDPTGEEGFARGGWFHQISAEDRQAWAQTECDEALAAAALLLGRRTYQFFAARWPSRTGRWADRLNGLPKYVVTATAQDLDWNNSKVLNGDVIDQTARLKDQVDGDIVVYSSRRLVHTLIEHDLVDEVRLIVFPLLLGAGARIFGDITEARPVRLISARTLGTSLTRLVYQRARLAQTAARP